MIIYDINLEHREDRRRQIETELVDVPCPVERVSGVHEPGFGALGCAESHAACRLAEWHRSSSTT